MENKGFICNLLNQFGQVNEKLIAFSIYDGTEQKEITYHQFLDDILNAAGYFAENQILGKHIAIAGANSYQWIVVLFAVMATGNVAVPLNPALPADMLLWQCKQADIALVCYDDPEIADKTGCIPAVSLDLIHGEMTIDIPALNIHEEDEPLIMMFTSGTTGKSKIVVLSARNMCVSVDNIFTAYKEREINQDTVVELMSLPLYHIGSLRVILNRLACMGTLAVGRGAKYVFMDIPKLNPTHVGMVPVMAESLARIIRKTSPDKMINYLGTNFKGIIAVGASMKPSVAQYLLEQGIRIDVLYGMTESAGDGSWCVLDTEHIGTIGKPDGNIDFRIQDGEILLRSDAVMKGYYKDPEETEKVIVDGWLHTGDMGYCDEDGYYYITGRKKNVIILSNGENVNPEEIEGTLGDCEAIEECLVYSDGKGICADVYASNRDHAADFIRAYNEDMPMYRQIYKVNYTEEPLEKTGSGKIKRKENK